jgi:hypothetical protein
LSEMESGVHQVDGRLQRVRVVRMTKAERLQSEAMARCPRCGSCRFLGIPWDSPMELVMEKAKKFVDTHVCPGSET